MMNTSLELKTMDDFLLEYNVYGDAFSKQIFLPEIWQEHTGCGMENYKDYLSCCMNRLYDFKTWYEHSYTEEFPVAWNEMSEYKFNVDLYST